jgi:hypothetical protein
VILLLTHQAAKIEISNLLFRGFFFFSWCALGYNSIPTLVCGLRNPFAIIIIIITIISCLASSHHQELSLAREGVTVYWNENYLYNTYRIYLLLQKVERLLHSNYAKLFF